MKTKKEIAFFVLTILFVILTFGGAGYVLVNKGQVNAGYAVIPMLIEIAFLTLYSAEKNKNGKNKKK